MGTRSRIGYQLPDNSIVSVYCHWDGYLEGVGRILAEHYQDREAVRELIDGGAISSLRTRGKWNANSLRDENGEYVCDAAGYLRYDDDREPQPLYYTERGEVLDIQHGNFEEFTSGQSGEEYAYLYDVNGNWRAYKLGWGDTSIEELSMPQLVTA